LRERDGLIATKWERRTKMIARLDDFGPNPVDTGRFQIKVTPEDADTIYVSEGGPPDPAISAKLAALICSRNTVRLSFPHWTKDAARSLFF
jgi:hypothetical protein